MGVICIVAAAGASRRLGHPKQLVRVDGETLIERSVRVAHQAGIERVLVVLGAYADPIQAVLDTQAYPLTLVMNAEWEQGLSSSIRVGVEQASAEPGCDGVLWMTCDQPHLTAEHLQALLGHFARHRQQRIVASGYSEIAGIPAIFPVQSFPALRELRGDEGARRLLRAASQPSPIIVPVEAAALDIDTPEDEARLAAWRQGREQGRRQGREQGRE